MSTVDNVANGTVSQKQKLVLTTFTLTLFTSAMLLFGVQPLFAKMVLPKLGGSTAVWSVALVFFQGVLLLGYLYAHALSKWVPFRVALPLHVTVLVSAFVFLPLSYPIGWQEPPQEGLSIWLIGLFAVGVGFPFFAVSSNAPLLQSWFSKTGHPHSSDPYFLYGASNIGSFVSLLAYPFIIEPVSTLGFQTEGWSVIYGVLIIGIVACGSLLWKKAGTSAYDTTIEDTIVPEAAPSWSDKGTWIGLAMVPSGLLVAVTAYISTDLASAPFMWVVPLALFLATFVITFQRKPIFSHALMLKIHGIIIAPALIFLFLSAANLVTIILHLVAFFVSAMVCHGELVRQRPAARYLTEFYLWMSFGGVLGGFFASLIAPNIFNSIAEYPILLLAVFLCRREFWHGVSQKKITQFWPLLIFATPFVSGLVGNPAILVKAGLIAAIFITMFLYKHTLQQALFVVVPVSLIYASGVEQSVITQVRSFFGVNKVATLADGKFQVLFHGSTIHGAQKLIDEDGKPVTGKPEPLTYYYRQGGLNVAIEHLRSISGSLNSVAVVGLGTGAMACHRAAGEVWKFYEIDPEVLKIARNPKLFRYLSACGESAGVVVGDGRITLGKEPDKKFDVIILDAFSSDSIPVHLMTTEALALYFAKLKPGGALVFHISNRFMELGTVVSSVAKTHGATTWVSQRNKKLWHGDIEQLKVMPVVAVVSKTKEMLQPFLKSERWHQFSEKQLVKPWSDDYSNLLGAIYRGNKDTSQTPIR